MCAAALAALGEQATGLTGRDRQLLGLMTQGLTDTQIAQQPSVTAVRARAEVAVVLGKLGLTGRHPAPGAAPRADESSLNLR